MRRTFLLSLFSLSLAFGCGDDKRAANVVDATGGKSNRGGSSNKGGDGGNGGDAGGGAGGDAGGIAGGGASAGAGGDSGGTTVVNQPGAPVVTFVSPLSVLDPNAAGVILTNMVTVTCKAEASSEAGSTVDPGSVVITMNQGADVIDAEPLGTAMVDGARESTFGLGNQDIVSGVVTFNCKANDKSSPTRYGAAEPLKLLVDRGPTIEFSKPTMETAVAVTAGVDVDFTITPNPLADNDEKEGVTKVEVTIAGRPVTVNESAPNSGRYTGHLSLTDPNVFPAGTEPNGTTTLQVIATNARGTIASLSQNFEVDGTAPTITVLSPTAGTVVGQNLQLTFTVTDNSGGAGVRPETVAVKINSLPVFFYNELQQARWSHPELTKYVFNLSEADLDDATAQATIQITATDKVGNTNAGQSMSLYLDFKPPIVNLDPPTVRERYFNNDDLVNKLVCSNAFDPLGEAINDLQIVGNAGYYRSLVWDDTNSAGEYLPRYYAGTDQDKVWLYVQDAIFAADGSEINQLLIDTDGDKYCDDIAPGLEGLRKPPLQLKPVAPTGFAPWRGNIDNTAFYAADDTRFGDAQPIAGYCDGQEWGRDDESYRCKSRSDMVRVIHHEIDSAIPEPVIYGNAPAVGDSIECTGRYWEIKPLISRPVRDGWVCMAAMAIDKVGNIGVSPPLRVCYDDPDTTFVPTCKSGPKLPEKEWSDSWSNFIPYGTVDTDPFPDRSAETPPTCMKGCKIRPQNIDRIIDNQTKF